MLWSGTRPGDTMADLIFCHAFLRLQMTLEERLTQRGIVNVTASARNCIFAGQHEEDCTSHFNPTFMDDLAVLVEGDSPTDVGQTLECTPDRERGLPRERPHSQHVGWQDGGNCSYRASKPRR